LTILLIFFTESAYLFLWLLISTISQLADFIDNAFSSICERYSDGDP